MKILQHDWIYKYLFMVCVQHCMTAYYHAPEYMIKPFVLEELNLICMLHVLAIVAAFDFN